MRFSGILSSFCGAALLFGCPQNEAVDDDEVFDPSDQRAEVGDPPEHGIQFLLPETDFEPGEDRMICFAPEWERNEDVWLQRLVAHQGSMGHHIAAFSGIGRSQGDVWDCSDESDMVTLNPLMIPDTEEGDRVIPDGHAFRLKPSTTVVLQYHYVNYSDTTITVRDIADFYFANADEVQEVGYLLVNSSDIDLDPGATGTFHNDCSLPADSKLTTLFGHMHELGTSMRVKRFTADDYAAVTGERAPADAAAPLGDILYDIPVWDPYYRDEPPFTHYAAEEMNVASTDTVRVECSYTNTRDHHVGFPEEMCSAVGVFYPVAEEQVVVCR